MDAVERHISQLAAPSALDELLRSLGGASASHASKRLRQDADDTEAQDGPSTAHRKGGQDGQDGQALSEEDIIQAVERLCAAGKICMRSLGDNGERRIVWPKHLAEDRDRVQTDTPVPLSSPSTPTASSASPKYRRMGFVPPQKQVHSEETLRKTLSELREQAKQVDHEIAALEQHYSVDELQVHIEKLHDYNEIKDVGQLVLGKLAESEGITTKAMYSKFGLDVED